MRRVLATLFVLLLIGTGGWLVAKTSRSDALTPGDRLPAITAAAPAGELAVRTGPHGAVVILFHSRCGHCHAQLDRMAAHAASLSGPIYLLTSEDSLPTADMNGRWSRLTAHPDVQWATVDPDLFLREFGTLVTPAVFVFGPDGRLVRKFRGEVKLELLSPA